MIGVDYPGLLNLFEEHLDPKRSESASFLIWYLENYFRLDSDEAVDAVCDQPGDKGVDGIFVNDNNQTITVFQAKISQSADKTIGDTPLKAFSGTLGQFENAERIRDLIESAGKAEVASLINRLDLVNKISAYELRGEFLSNVDTDGNGEDFLKCDTRIRFVGKSRLQSTYISDVRDTPTHTPFTFDILGFHVTEYSVDANTKAVIAPIKASQLVGLSGISDQSLFAFNVRGPLGKTQVNKDIVASIRDPALHKLFPLFHNGITVISKELNTAEASLTISDYFVVNGCQSLTALYDNREKISEGLRILTKFIRVDPESDVAAKVTKISNNQNGVKARDFRANNSQQIRLQNEFRQHYEGEYSFEIKRGEAPEPGTIVSNEEAGLFLMAFDLKEPWATHRKYQVFEEKYADLFGRPEVTADRIVMCQVIREAIDSALPSIKNSLFARYRLTRYLLLYIVRQILENDGMWEDINTNPYIFVREVQTRDKFRNCIRPILNDIAIDLNAEVDEYGDDFDYRGRLRDAEWVRELSKTIVAEFLKLVQRERIKSFSDEWTGGADIDF